MTAKSAKPDRNDTAFLEVVRNAPLVSIDLIVRDHDGRILVGRRVNQPAKGTWFVPGGSIRKGETLARALARISDAELGVALGPGDVGFARRNGIRRPTAALMPSRTSLPASAGTGTASSCPTDNGARDDAPATGRTTGYT
jgi:hypothetical protein